MKLIVLCLLSFAVSLQAGDQPVKSQTGATKYEIRITDDPAAGPDAGYVFTFVERATGRRLGTVETGAACITPATAVETTTVVWHPAGDLVAFTGRATKHSTELYLYSLRDGKPVRLNFQDYVQNALGRVDAVSTGLSCVSTPLPWIGDDLPVKLYFSVDRPESGRHFYETSVMLRVDHSPNAVPMARLVSVKPPVKAAR